MGKTLIEILKQFENNKNNWKGTWNENAVAECFKPCAIDLLCKGYFLVNGKYIIDLGAIELYYHEEKTNGIKDHIMYHTNEHLAKAELCKKGYPYFKFGSLNLHTSGVDVTFEKEKDEETGEVKNYRASFLIRAYRAIKIDDNKDVQKILHESKPVFDCCSTHIFDDMFIDGISFDGENKTEINWLTLKTSKNVKIEQLPRKNVSVMYKKDNGKFEKVTKEYYEDKNNVNVFENEEYKSQISKVEYFSINKKMYLQDQRPWLFVREDLIEKFKK